MATRTPPPRKVDFGNLIPRDDPAAWVKPFKERAQARLYEFQPITVADRFAGFRAINFKPHGIFLPADEKMRQEFKKRLWDIGQISELVEERDIREGERNVAYQRFQDETEALYLAGVPGEWTGQQAIARSPARFRIAALGRRAGKALALDTKLPTPSGWTTMGDVGVGDELFDEQGAKCRVTFATPVMVAHDCFEVTFSDGQMVVADADHLWAVQGKKHRRSDYGPARGGYDVVTTRDLAKDDRTSIAWAVVNARPIALPEAGLPVDPYVLGAWLGDGTSMCARITCVEPEIVHRLKSAVAVQEFRYVNRTTQYSIGTVGVGGGPAKRSKSVAWKLRELGVMGTKAEHCRKHIPPMYLRASQRQRLALLQGLMDTDGCVGERGNCEYTTTRRELAEGIVELLGTLGQQAHYTEGRATLYGRDCGATYRVNFRPTIPVFSIERKLKRQKIGDGWFRTKRYIRSVVAVDSVPVRCIQVDSESHLFLCAGFIPTHNTKEAAAEALGIALTRPRSIIWLAAPTAKLVDRSWQYVMEFLDDLGLRGDCQVRDQVQEKRCITPNKSRIEGVSCENVMSMAGDKVDFAVVDECSQIVPDTWERGILPPLTDRRGGALLISSYDGEGDFFSNKILELKKEEERAKQFGFEPEKRWAMFEAPSYDVNFYAYPQGIETKSLKDMQSEMDVATFQEQFGSMVAGSRDRVFPEFIERVHVGNYPFNPQVPVYLACDPSSGANPYAILVIQDYKDYLVVIDELYEKNVKAEDYDPVMRRRPWAENVVEMVVDSAWPHDIARWNGLGWRAFAVQKPLIAESIPLVKNYLRNAKLFDQYYRARVNEVLVEMGYQPNDDFHLPEPVQKKVYFEVGQRMSTVTDNDIDVLKECSRFFVNAACVHTIREFRSYAYQRRRNLQVNFKESPRDYENHLIDSFRYWLWTYHKFDSEEHPKLTSYVTYHVPREAPPGVTELPKETSQQAQGRLWLTWHRNLHATRSNVRSYMQARA